MFQLIKTCFSNWLWKLVDNYTFLIFFKLKKCFSVGFWMSGMLPLFLKQMKDFKTFIWGLVLWNRSYIFWINRAKVIFQVVWWQITFRPKQFFNMERLWYPLISGNFCLSRVCISIVNWSFLKQFWWKKPLSMLFFPFFYSSKEENCISFYFHILFVEVKWSFCYLVFCWIC